MNSLATDTPLSSNTELILYADDILVFKPIDSLSDVTQLQHDINSILSWTVSQGLSINNSKTQLLPVTRSHRPLHLNITVNGHTVVPSKSVKYLGVTLSSNLTWNAHIKGVCKAAKRQLGMIHRKFRHAPVHLRHQIYRSTTLAKLEYCCAVWDPHYSTDKQALESVQKFAGRVITGQWRSDYPSLLAKLNWKTLATRRMQQKLKVCYNVVKNLSCIPPDIFTPHPHPSPRLHPHSKPLLMPYVKTLAHKFSFFVDVVSHWNALPKFIVESCSPFSFKSNLKKYTKDAM